MKALRYLMMMGKNHQKWKKSHKMKQTNQVAITLFISVLSIIRPPKYINYSMHTNFRLLWLFFAESSIHSVILFEQNISNKIAKNLRQKFIWLKCLNIIFNLFITNLLSLFHDKPIDLHSLFNLSHSRAIMPYWMIWLFCFCVYIIFCSRINKYGGHVLLHTHLFSFLGKRSKVVKFCQCF